jgi:uncharacterized OB-fold protein
LSPEQANTIAVFENRVDDRRSALFQDEVDPWKITRGMKVKAVWKPAEERTGAITDIKYFKPIK